MKKIIVVICVIMVFSLASCQVSIQSDGKRQESGTMELTTEKITQNLTENSEKTQNEETENIIDNDTLQLDYGSLTNQILDSLKSKGWQDIEIAEGEIDYLARFHVVVNHFEHREEEKITTIMGKTALTYLDLYAIVRIVSNAENNSERIGDIQYISDSGRILNEVYFNIIKSEDANNEILSAGNKELINYFEAY